MKDRLHRPGRKTLNRSLAQPLAAAGVEVLRFMLLACYFLGMHFVPNKTWPLSKRSKLRFVNLCDLALDILAERTYLRGPWQKLES